MANMKIKCKFSFLVMESKDFSISRYELLSPVALPSGKKTQIVTIKGYNLPREKGVYYEIEGEFEVYEKGGKTSYTLKAEKVEEIIPTEEESIVAYLMTLSGIGKTTAKRLYDEFEKKVFKVIESEPDKLAMVKGISKSKAFKIQTSFAIRRSAKELFSFLYPFGISNSLIMRIHKELGSNAINCIQNNPYTVLNIQGIGFKTADNIARKLGFHKDNPDRIKAGILETLSQAEYGGDIFNKATPFPAFMLGSFLSNEYKEKLLKEEIYTTGGTYLDKATLYLMSLKLLDIKLSLSDFTSYLEELALNHKVVILPDGDNEAVYKEHLARTEFNEAMLLAKHLKSPLPSLDGLLATIRNMEKLHGILLSDEQRAAVIKALTSPVSIITGGPGTGKTSIQKIILAVFRKYYPKDGILLVAPTGKAAKRMSEQTGYPASTLHKALGLYQDEAGFTRITSDSMRFPEKLIIVDETSMVGSYLFSTLLSHLAKGTRLVLIGDTDQLPSIEVGSVLRELIASDVIPTTKLTKTFRQASGSSIIVNAARIKIGEDQLLFGDDFSFIECENSEKIAEKACEIIPKLISIYGEENVMCLTAFRRNTTSGSNALNERLRRVIRPISPNTPSFDIRGTKIYEGDKVMNLKNTEFLTNGDIGTVKKILISDGVLTVTCDFEGNCIVLEDEQVQSLELAYATTVHKSQGSEASCVVLTADMAHKIMLKRNLFYTGVTRAKEKLIVLGQKDAMNMAIKSQDSVFRKSKLGMLIKKYVVSPLPKEEPNVQLSLF